MFGIYFLAFVGGLLIIILLKMCFTEWLDGTDFWGTRLGRCESIAHDLQTRVIIIEKKLKIKGNVNGNKTKN